MALHLVPDVLFIGAAALAASPVLAVLSSILRSELMAVLAMGLCAIACAICGSAQSKARFVNLLFWQKNAFSWPAKVNPLVNGLVRNSELGRPLHCCLPFAAKLQKTIDPSVALLACSSGPSAISGFVVAIIVNSINRHAVRGMPHIFKKIRQTINPSIAYFYTSATVVFVSAVVGVKTSLLNAVPYRFDASPAKPVGSIAFVNFSKMGQLFFSNHNNSPLGVYSIQRKWSQS